MPEKKSPEPKTNKRQRFDLIMALSRKSGRPISIAQFSAEASPMATFPKTRTFVGTANKRPILEQAIRFNAPISSLDRSQIAMPKWAIFDPQHKVGITVPGFAS